MSARWVQLAGVLALAGALAACGGATQTRRRGNARARGVQGVSAEIQAASGGEGRCDARQPNREESQYDTSGDDQPDVRKVFARVGVPPTQRLVLICREADLNSDGTKDVVRYYNDDGRPIREEADRDFNGSVDSILYFEEGQVAREESDASGDGRVDTKVFYEAGVPVRAERDMEGRSTPDAWRPDRWEYYDGGRLVRMGTDIDGDGRVDHWDREHGGSDVPGGPVAENDDPPPADAGAPGADAGPPATAQR